jgi:hypothetical protein
VPGAVKQTPQVKFTRQQIEWLEQQYPEVTGTAQTSDAELRFRSGQRSVIAAIKTRAAEQQESYGPTE